MKHRFQYDDLPDSVIQNLASRDAALWVGPNLDVDDDQLAILQQLIALPWQLVICESTSGALARSLESSSQSSNRMSRQRGFVHLVAADPESLELPPRSLPVFFLNGRDDAPTAEESPQRAPRAMQRRRLNMINRLAVSNPRLLLVLSSGTQSPLDEAFELWEEGFRALLVVHSSNVSDAARLDNWLTTATSASAIAHCTAPFIPSVSRLIDRVAALFPDDRRLVRIRTSSSAFKDVDITDCELVEQPIFDRYDLIQPRELHVLLPDELTADDLNSFFDRSKESWKPFAAGLPWQRNQDAKRKLLRALSRTHLEGPDRNSIQLIASETGAGGTTLAKYLAFEAARDGYPTLIARAVKFHPKAIELETFLYRVRQTVVRAVDDSTTASADTKPPDDGPDYIRETPWLIVYDVHHWEGRLPEILTLARSLGRSGRPIVLLVVTDPDIGEELTNSQNVDIIDTLSHGLSEADAMALGEHLNRYLAPFGKQRTQSQWRYFWERHRPLDMDADVASFWITLEFWLKGQFDLSETIQQWIARHFKQAQLSDYARTLLLEIASLSIERQPYLEQLLPPSPDGENPFSIQLADTRSAVPALALMCTGTPPNRQWAMAHDLIGRYLVNSAYFDRLLLARLGFDGATDPVHLRLLLLRRIATNRDLGRKQFRSLAVEFAVNILKLGVDGNLEFARHWRDVLQILDDMPRIIWETSRTFNHHVAISRRRVATMADLYELSLDEKAGELTKAIEHLEYALNRLERTESDDESDLNLFNSLSLAYQNLADVERDRGAGESRLRELREKATEAARQAQRESPVNSYVLETFARNLLQNGRLYPLHASVCAAEALGYIYQAMSLDRSLLRETRLTRLANEALALLRSEDASNQLNQVCAAGNPLGFLGKAWLALAAGEEQLTKENLATVPKAKLEQALIVINAAPTTHPLLIQFKYDLLTVSDPRNFEEQLNLLDELEGTDYSIPLQLQLERAILLHQRNRHTAANVEFRHIRDQLRSQDVYVDVPARLRWLLADDGSRRVCHARVVETRDYRSHAKVRELKDAIIPFIAREFGRSRMPAGMSFTCTISFGAMGPFVKPPDLKKEDE